MGLPTAYPKMANALCPICRNGLYLRWIGGRSTSFHRTYDAKCLSCNQMFMLEDLYFRPYKGKHEKKEGTTYEYESK